MSARDAFTAADHERARELAATRIDEILPPADAVWLADHLAACPACASVDAAYAALHVRFAALRENLPQPPRDLWARTSAAIDAERGRRAATGRWRGLRRSPRGSTRLALAPVVAMVAIVVVVGASLLNGLPTVPGGTAVAATPIAIKGAADLQVLALDSAGNLQLLSRRVDQVCPTGVADCGVSPTFAVTAVSAFGNAADLFGAMSPTGGQMVVIRRDPGSQGVYVVPVKPASASTPPRSTTDVSAGSQPPSHSVTTPSSASASPSAGASSPGTSPASGSPSSAAAGSASPSPSDASASPSGSPNASPTTASASPSPSDSLGSASPSVAATPTASSATATASPSDGTSPQPASSPAPTVVPSLDVSPAPDAAIKIASGVTVVGAPTYSPDGSRLAFSAMPSDASSGPDIYVWAVGDRSAQSITSDHNSWLAGWTSSGILVSRVDNGLPTTFRLDPVTGRSVPIGAPGTWLPAVSPTGTAAAWWAGTVRLAADGVTWVPDQGRLVLGAWPGTGSAGPASQVLAKGPLDAWQVRWDNTGSVVAAWLVQTGARSGQLSLYSVDQTTSVADLANPMLDATPANADFSLRAGRLAWTVPAQSAPQTVEVLAWSGKTVYPRMELPADGSGTVVP